jgi:branched-chain amino acid transport system permease protein
MEGLVSYFITFAIFVAIWSIFALGLNVHWGYTGVFNFGIAGFFMVGAYTTAIVTKDPAVGGSYSQYVGGLQMPFYVGIGASALAAGALALLIGIPTLRLRADYLAIATIGAAEALRRVAINERDLVNGTRGMIGIPAPLQGVLSTRSDYYNLMFLGLAVLVLVIIYVAIERGIRSPWGRVLRALREDETTVAASGKNVDSFRMQSFVLGAMIMGVGGAMYALNIRAIAPDTFEPFFGTFIIWAMLIVGGAGNNKGAILGALVVWGIWSGTGQLTQRMPDFLEVRVFYFRLMFIGMLIVGVLLLRPNGILGEERRVSIFVERQARREARKAKQPPGPQLPAG